MKKQAIGYVLTPCLVAGIATNLTLKNFIMKTEIGYSLVGDMNNVKLSELNIIISRCLTAKDKTELKRKFDDTDFNYFIFGFGGNHFWAKQKNHLRDNLIFVEF